MTLLNATDLTIQRRGAAPLTLPALTLGRDQHALLLGPSGCGKTSWLLALGGLLSPAAGTVTFDDQNLYALPRRARDKLRGRSIGFVFQTLHLLPALTIRNNILLAAQMADAPADHDRLGDILARLGLTEKADRHPESLSQGEQQRAAIARALYNRPALILADEPTAALDDANAESVARLLIDTAAETNAALLIATHDARLRPHFERIIAMNDTAKDAA